VHSVTLMKLARRLCPESVPVRGDMDRYTMYSSMVTEIIAETSPVVEKASVDEHYLDLMRMDRLRLLEMEPGTASTNCPGALFSPSLGTITDITVSKIAKDEAKPCGERQMLTGEEKPFLTPLAVSGIRAIVIRLCYGSLEDLHTRRSLRRIFLVAGKVRIIYKLFVKTPSESLVFFLWCQVNMLNCSVATTRSGKRLNKNKYRKMCHK
jgi:hypothetical protein